MFPRGTPPKPTTRTRHSHWETAPTSKSANSEPIPPSRIAAWAAATCPQPVTKSGSRPLVSKQGVTYLRRWPETSSGSMTCLRSRQWCIPGQLKSQRMQATPNYLSAPPEDTGRSSEQSQRGGFTGILTVVSCVRVRSTAPADIRLAPPNSPPESSP